MSITRSISVAQTDDRVLKTGFQETNTAIDIHERKESKMSITPTMIMPRYLSVRTKRTRYTKEVEREDDKLSITRSISVAGSYVDYSFY